MWLRASKINATPAKGVIQLTSNRLGRIRRLIVATLALSVVAIGFPARADTRYLETVFTAAEKTQSDVIYGSAPKFGGGTEILYLDVWEGVGDNATGRAAIVFAHGGGFAGGSRHAGGTVGLVERWAKRGFVVINIDYRIRPGKTIPELVAEGAQGHSDTMQDAQYDMQAAVRWTRANAGSLGVDTNTIIASGESAGAITAWHTGVNDADPNATDNPGYSSEVSAVLSLWGTAIPAQVDPGGAPVIDLHNAGDTTVPEGFGAQACALMIAHGNVCEHVLWASGGHTAFPRSDEIVETTSNFACRYAIPGCVSAAPLPIEVRT